MNKDLFKIVYIPKVNFEVKAEPIMHQTRKEKVKWWIETLKLRFMVLKYKFSLWKCKYLR